VVAHLHNIRSPVFFFCCFCYNYNFLRRGLRFFSLCFCIISTRTRTFDWTQHALRQLPPVPIILLLLLLYLLRHNSKSLRISANNNYRLQTPTNHLYFIHYTLYIIIIIIIIVVTCYYIVLFDKRPPITSFLIENWFCTGLTRE